MLKIVLVANISFLLYEYHHNLHKLKVKDLNNVNFHYYLETMKTLKRLFILFFMQSVLHLYILFSIYFLSSLLKIYSNTSLLFMIINIIFVYNILLTLSHIHVQDAKEETNVLKQEIETLQKGIRYQISNVFFFCHITFVPTKFIKLYNFANKSKTRINKVRFL